MFGGRSFQCDQFVGDLHPNFPFRAFRATTLFFPKAVKAKCKKGVFDECFLQID